MKKILTYFTLIIVIVLQSSVLSRIELVYITPNLVLTFMVCYSMYSEPTKALVFSIVAGLVVDILQAHHIGLTALLFMFIAVALSVASSDYIRTNIITIMVAVAVSTVLFESLYGFLLYVIFNKMTAKYMFGIILFETIYNVVASLGFMWWGKFLAEDEIRSF